MSFKVKDYARLYLFIINTITAIKGLVIIFIGIYCTAKSNNVPFTNIETGNLIAFIVLTTVFGLFVFMLGVCGVICSINQSPAMINVYVRLLSVVLILQVAILVGCFVAKPDITRNTDVAWAHFVDSYNSRYTPTSLRYTVDVIQENLECCGYTGSGDFTPAPPPSCCANSSVRFFQQCPENSQYMTGCRDVLPHLVENAIHLLAIVIGFSLLLDIISLSGAWFVKENASKYDLIG